MGCEDTPHLANGCDVLSQHTVCTLVSERLAFKQVPHTKVWLSIESGGGHLLVSWQDTVEDKQDSVLTVSLGSASLLALWPRPLHSQPLVSCPVRNLGSDCTMVVHLRRIADGLQPRADCLLASRLTHHAMRASGRSACRELTSTTPPNT